MDRSIDFAKLARWQTVNYLHCADGLDVLCDRVDRGGTVDKATLLAHIDGVTRPGVRDLVNGYQPGQSTVDLAVFSRDLQIALDWRGVFRSLDVRGFSYALDLEMRDYNKA